MNGVLVAHVAVLSVTYTRCCRQTDSTPPTQSYCGFLRSLRRWRAHSGPPRAQNTSGATWPCRGPSLRSQSTPLTGHTHADTHEEQRLTTWELVVDPIYRYLAVFNYLHLFWQRAGLLFWKRCEWQCLSVWASSIVYCLCLTVLSNKCDFNFDIMRDFYFESIVNGSVRVSS